MPAATMAKALPDLCADLFAYVIWLTRSEAAAKLDAKAVYQRFDELLREFDAEGRRAGSTPENVRLVLFALVAFADEAVLTSQHPARAAWAEQPLQLAYFNENSAGEEFYNRLDGVRKAGGPQAADVLESFYLCLSLGFRGRYVGSPRLEKLRKSVMEQLAEELRALRGETAALLSPRGRPAAPAAAATPGMTTLWTVPLAVLAVLVVLLAAWNWSLRDAAVAAAAAFR